MVQVVLLEDCRKTTSLVEASLASFFRSTQPPAGSCSKSRGLFPGTREEQWEALVDIGWYCLRRSEPLISCVLPTRNCGQEMEAHVRAMGDWAEFVSEIHLVDSESEDETIAWAERLLPPEKLQVHRRPPGLYQAWNYGIKQCVAPWLYFSTIGDLITGMGLLHLLRAVDENQADCVVSPPRMERNADAAEGGLQVPIWPPEKISEWLSLTRPQLLSSGELAVYTSHFCIETYLNSYSGSCASNLFRTGFLKEHLFPEEFGHIGDVGWAIRCATKIRLVVSPNRVASFQLPEAGYSPLTPQDEVRFYSGLCQEWKEQLARWSGDEKKMISDALWENSGRREKLLQVEGRLLHIRRKWKFCWMLWPEAWRLRREKRERREQSKSWLKLNEGFPQLFGCSAKKRVLEE
ncbi:MAG: glycosyltransferase [Verrucomicrobiota bacterium]